MNLKYFDTSKVSHIVEEYFELSFPKEALPFKTTFLPIGLTSIINISKGLHEVVLEGTIKNLSGIFISGQFFRSYQFMVNVESKCFGISFHPTALFKLLNTDISKFENRHIPLEQINNHIYDELSSIFNQSKTNKELIKALNVFFINAPLTTNNNTKLIDQATTIIREKDGLLNVLDVLDEIPMSQKTLETQFKKIVGLTPGKYIRLYRFLKLMRKYESQEIDIKDLIHMYDYYDRSHFTKDFKLFMKESPKDYFNTTHPFLNEYLNK